MLTGSGSSGLDLTRVSRSPYIPEPDCLPSGGLTAAFVSSNFPKGTALALAATTNIGVPGATTPARYYYDGDLVIGGGTIGILNITGPVILYINGNLQITGSAANVVNVFSTGSAEIHIAGRLMADVAGNGFDNKTLDPKKLILICDTATSSTQYYSDASTSFYGAIYAPNTTNATGLNFGSASTTRMYGAVSAKKIYYTTNATLHYDTSLRYATFGGVDAPYMISEWRELTDATEKITLP
ncbi:MAG: hypothetical protein PSW75_12385 [bacterium]|nr:hypothetical protein [bacterium]